MSETTTPVDTASAAPAAPATPAPAAAPAAPAAAVTAAPEQSASLLASDAKAAEPTTSKDGADQNAPEKNADVAPEKYEPFKMPDGMELDPVANEAFVKVAKEFNLTQDKAQKIAEIGAVLAKNQAAKMEEAWKSTNEKWTSEIKSDKEFGGNNLNQTLAYAQKAIAKYGGEGLKAALNTSWGNNPDFIRTFARIGKAMSEDTAIDGSAATAATRSAAEVIYDGK